MSKYPVHQIREREWYPDLTLGGERSWSAIDGDLSIHISDNGDRYVGEVFNDFREIFTLSDKPPLSSFDEAEAALLAAVEAADKPEWIDAKSGLAAMCEWRGWTMATGYSGGRFDYRCFMDSRECCSGYKYKDRYAAKSAAEAWVREQTGKGETK